MHGSAEKHRKDRELTVEFIMDQPFHGKCTASHLHSMASTVTFHRHHCDHHHHHHPFHHRPHHHHHHHCNSFTLKPHSVLLHKHTFHPNRHFHFCPRFTQYPSPSPSLPPTISQEPESDTSVYNNPGDLNFMVPYFKDDEASEAQLLQEGFQEGEDEEEPIYVMTDEWAEFFAKSEEKRRLEKKLAKKKKKKGN